MNPSWWTFLCFLQLCEKIQPCGSTGLTRDTPPTAAAHLSRIPVAEKPSLIRTIHVPLVPSVAVIAG
jgi:hypothetical protein